MLTSACTSELGLVSVRLRQLLYKPSLVQVLHSQFYFDFTGSLRVDASLDAPLMHLAGFGCGEHTMCHSGLPQQPCMQQDSVHMCIDIQTGMNL